MSVRHTPLLLAALIVLTTAGQAFAGLCGLAGHVLRRQSRCGCAPQVSDCEVQCHTVMKTMTRTIYETVNETCHKTVYDTSYETKVIQGVERIPIMSYRERSYTYYRPQVTYLTKEVPYTFSWPVYETLSRDIHYVSYVPTYGTRTRHVPYTTYHTVSATHTRTVYYTVPRTIHYTQTIPIHGGRWATRTEECPGPVREKCVQDPGCWKWDPCCCRCIYVPGPCRRVKIQCPPIKVCRRVWVPTVEHRTIQCNKVVYESRSRQVPYTTTRLVPQTHTRPITYTVTNMMPVTRTRTVSYQVARMMSEQRVRTVTYPVTRMIPETGTQTVPVTTYREVPTSSTIVVPHSVPRTVTYTVARCVPRIETYQVPVRICVSIPKCVSDPCCDPPCCDTNCCDGGGSAAANDAGGMNDDGVLDAPVDLDEPGDLDIPAPAPIQEASLKLMSLAQREVSLPEASLLFTTGLGRLRSGDHRGAVNDLSAACEASPSDAKYAYYLAVAHRRAGLDNQALTTLARAIELENAYGIARWGRTMQRIQGADRLWLEDARSNARM